MPSNRIIRKNIGKRIANLIKEGYSEEVAKAKAKEEAAKMYGDDWMEYEHSYIILKD